MNDPSADLTEARRLVADLDAERRFLARWITEGTGRSAGALIRAAITGEPPLAQPYDPSDLRPAKPPTTPPVWRDRLR